MLKQELIPLDDKVAWDLHLRDIPHGPAHTWGYNYAIAQSSNLPTYLYAAKGSNFKAACPISIRMKLDKKDIVTPYGFGGFISQGDHPDFNKSWQHYFYEKNIICCYLSIHPSFNSSLFFPQEDVNTASAIYMLDLTQPIEAIYSQISKIYRYDIRKLQNNKISIITDKDLLIKHLPSMYKNTIHRVNAASVYDFSINTLTQLVGEEASLTIGIIDNGEILSISHFNYTLDMADYFLNACHEEGRVYAKYLIWEAIQQFKTLGIKTFNLGGGVKAGDSLEQFKRRFGGEQKNNYVLKQIFDIDTFTELCKLTNQSNMQEITYFPPYHQFSRN
jgi:hypothetical protein